MSLTGRRNPPCGCSSDQPRPAGGPVPPIEPAGARLIVPIALTCDDVEVTQAIQSLAHDVPLVAAKRTIVRIYLSASAPAPVTVQGLLKVRRFGSTGPWRYVPSLGPVSINPAENGQVRLKRENESKSLNFQLPDACTLAGKWDIKLALVYQTAPFRLLLPPHDARETPTFVDSPPLRVRIIGIRFQGGTPPASIEPSPLDFTLIRSWLGRAFPVASVVYSQVTVDSPLPWEFFASDINAFVRAIRTADVLGGVDARTHYYGLVSDGGGGFFMRGLASGIPGVPDPSTVASGPTGSNTWGWETDGSYGDWYTGHELGHTFGRFHAEFCGAGGGAPYPFVNGQLSNADGAYVGFDTGDLASGLPIRALPGPMWHDVMSYCAFQWLSSFTYTGIRDRLVQEESLPAGAMLPTGRGARGRRARSAQMSTAGTIHVVATLNLTRSTGKFQHVTPVAAVPPGQRELAATRGKRSTTSPSGQDASLRVVGKGDRRLGEYAAPIIPDACLNPGDDVTGTVDAVLSVPPDATRLELVLGGRVIDTFTPPAAPRSVRDIRVAPRARGTRAAGEADNPVLTWGETGRRATRTRGRGARAEAPRGGPTYTVQVSTDTGQTWQTVGFALRDPRVVIDRELIGDADTVRVRVTSTNGFRSVASETTLKAVDLKG